MGMVRTSVWVLFALFIFFLVTESINEEEEEYKVEYRASASAMEEDLKRRQLQQKEGVKKGKKRRGKKGPKVVDEKMIKALSVKYPLDLFTNTLMGEVRNWREPAYLDKDFIRESKAEKQYADLAQAQDQEDIWLYENWFYGMKEGVIMESGALNGLLFSTSYMFEKFANWTALHVGEYII